MTEEWNNIYSLRETVAQRRQQKHSTHLSSLENILTSVLKKDHPYKLTYQQKLEFCSIPGYQTDAFGAQAVVPSQSFLYRMCTIETLILNTEWITPEAFRLSDEDEWSQINQRQDELGDWVPLREFAGGQYKLAPRIFSWWTSMPLHEDVVFGAHRIGIVNDWVGEHTLILRCPVDYITNNDLAFVPSVIDAYTHPVFHPTNDGGKPVYGITIDLSFYPMTLVPGTDEVLLAPISTNYIDIMPIRVDNSKRHARASVLLDDAEFIDLLHLYYSNL